jgi:Raf kinase inhibitor-like YbhB/YbcL family protein
MRQAAMRVVSVLAAGLAIATLASGCGLLGGPGGTRLGPATSITVTSPVTGPEATLPRAYTCRGAGISPPLYWSGVPEPQTKSLVIVIDDSQAPINPYIYWLVYNVSPGTTSIPEGGLPVGAQQGPNSTGRTRYAAPCPGASHDMYRFTVYALNSRPDLIGDSLRQAWWTIAQHVIASGRLTVRADA